MARSSLNFTDHAAIALASSLASPAFAPSTIAADAYAIADALWREREARALMEPTLVAEAPALPTKDFIALESARTLLRGIAYTAGVDTDPLKELAGIVLRIQEWVAIHDGPPEAPHA